MTDAINPRSVSSSVLEKEPATALLAGHCTVLRWSTVMSVPTGRAPGTISLILWGPGVRRQYDVVVEPGISTLEQQLKALFPGEDIRLSYSNEALVLSGTVSSTDVMLRTGEIATASSADTRIINLLQVPGGDISQ